MEKVTEAFIIIVRQMHAHLAGLNDMHEIIENSMDALDLPEEQRALIRKEMY